MITIYVPSLGKRDTTLSMGLLSISLQDGIQEIVDKVIVYLPEKPKGIVNEAIKTLKSKVDVKVKVGVLPIKDILPDVVEEASDYLLRLDDDAQFLSKKTLMNLIKHLPPDFGAVGGSFLVLGDYPYERNYPDCFTVFKNSLFGILIPKAGLSSANCLDLSKDTFTWDLWRRVDTGIVIHDGIVESDTICGTCAMYRTEVLKEVISRFGLDDTFFGVPLKFDDLYLSLAIRKLGYKLYFLPTHVFAEYSEYRPGGRHVVDEKEMNQIIDKLKVMFL